ncbi:MAG: diaminopimelate decarboxylase [Planctomycetaceae bacterium]|jgi:diaminopimelate decarboxylase|nr:diaminopimelate decarboxylase [Planctomycetaceae bacterium]
MKRENEQLTRNPIVFCSLPLVNKKMKPLPFDRDFIENLSSKYPTPFYLYDERTLRQNARSFNAAFAWNAGFKEYFAVKANPNPALLKILQSENLGGDCSSLAELVICERIGITGENIMFTSNDTPAAEFVKAAELGAIINLDDITHIDFLAQSLQQIVYHSTLPELLSFRWNPGALRNVESVIGNPVEAKYGLTTEQMFEAYRIAKRRGVKRFGLHTMIASNMLDGLFFRFTAQTVFELVRKIERQTDIRIEFVNIGGGFGTAYRPEETPLDMRQVGALIYEEYEKAKMSPLKIFTESGRWIAASAGTLITRVIHRKDIYKRYVGVDACMANLMRPGMYAAYHHISVLDKETETFTRTGSISPPMETVDIVGSLCENCDKFAVDRKLPMIEIGDFLAIHDAGAHGYSMGFQYNGKLRCAELLLQEDGTVRQIRRAETLDDYFATMEWDTAG